MPRNPNARVPVLDPDEYAALLAAQGGGCAICGNPPKARRLDTDHDHKTGEVRGLLCHADNRGVRWDSDGWLSRATAYLPLRAPMQLDYRQACAWRGVLDTINSKRKDGPK